MLAIPRLQLPKVRGPILGVAALVVVLLVALGVVALLLKSPGPAAAVRVPLSAAPAGWAQALHPAHGAPTAGRETIRLLERPPAQAASVAANTAPIMPPGVEAGPLPPAPIAGLFTPGPSGPLPVIAADGRMPFDAYRRPFSADGRPKVALVVRGLGLNAQATRAAIETLRPEITLSFIVYADGLQGWIDQARAHGHEVLLEAPMEPADYPDNDPGPYTLMAQAPPAQTVQRLEWILSRASGYFGVTNYLGQRFLGSDAGTAALAAALRGRGLAFIDDGAGRGRAAGPRRASAERVIDANLAPAAIDQQLDALEAGARASGQALAMAGPYPLTLDKVTRWTAAVESRGLSLAPASALAAGK